MKKLLCLIALVLAFSTCLTSADAATAKILAKEIEYAEGDLKMKGFLVYPEVKKKVQLPAVLVVHEWWGHNDYARTRAKQLAKLGYVALAVDMFGEGKKAAHPDDAKKFAAEATQNFDVARARFNAALDFVRQQPQVDAGRIAAIGYCFGGGVVLNMARQGADLRGVASFHGSLAPARAAGKGAVKARIIVFNGADDAMIKPEQIEAFKKEMTDAGADFTFINYPRTKHSFSNPEADRYAKEFNLDLAYNKSADQKSWYELRRFLKSIFSSK